MKLRIKRRGVFCRKQLLLEPLRSPQHLDEVLLDSSRLRRAQTVRSRLRPG